MIFVEGKGAIEGSNHQLQFSFIQLHLFLYFPLFVEQVAQPDLHEQMILFNIFDALYALQFNEKFQIQQFLLNIAVPFVESIGFKEFRLRKLFPVLFLDIHALGLSVVGRRVLIIEAGGQFVYKYLAYTTEYV